MSQEVFISICIPAYKNIQFLKRLLNSISIQTFTDYEVIITDDSPDDSVANFVSSYKEIENVLYKRNQQTLGTPGNWNECIRMAKGDWIKLMHDDDWFVDSSSLQQFAILIKSNPQFSFFYSAYFKVDLDKYSSKAVFASTVRRSFLKRNPVTLFSKNIIGPPSVTIYKRYDTVEYDEKLKWLVDIDFYIRYLRMGQPYYFNSLLVNIGMSDIQVTRESSMLPEVEIPEHFRVLNKTGIGCLKNILVYDAWWRLLRNMRISSMGNLRKAGYEGDVPGPVVRIISIQRHIPDQMLSYGLVSKILMFTFYLTNRIIYSNR
jgi:glycosyltransferase involved in cell wall biosynthesis